MLTVEDIVLPGGWCLWGSTEGLQPLGPRSVWDQPFHSGKSFLQMYALATLRFSKLVAKDIVSHLVFCWTPVKHFSGSLMYSKVPFHQMLSVSECAYSLLTSSQLLYFHLYLLSCHVCMLINTYFKSIIFFNLPLENLGKVSASDLCKVCKQQSETDGEGRKNFIYRYLLSIMWFDKTAE